MSTPSSTAKGAAHCSTCQAVCCRLKVVVRPEDSIPVHLTTYTAEGLHVMKRGEDGWCTASNSTHMNCGIYETRPAQCRRFVMNGPYCKAIRAEYGDPAPSALRSSSAEAPE